MDLEKVSSGVRFLSHPDVQATPLSERLSFLEKKGLTRAEINAAIEQHHQNSSHSASSGTEAAVSMWSYVYPILGTTALLSCLWKYMQNDNDKLSESSALEYSPIMQEGVPGPSLAQAVESQTEEIAKLIRLLHEETKDRQKQNQKQAKHEQDIAELKSEIASLKLKLSNVDEKPSNPGQSEKAESNGNSTDFLAQSKKMLDALRLVETENPIESIKQAASILIMYTKNLVEHPDVPRYRRIAVGNANFKQKIEPLVHYDKLLTSIGFEKSGMNMEWKWHSAPEYDCYIEILKAAILAFESAVASASSGSTLVEIAEQHLAKSSGQSMLTNEKESKEEGTPNLESFLARLTTKGSTAGDESKNEKYPTSFSDVMQLVESGEEIPGILDIEDKLSTDAGKCLEAPSSTEIDKPWAK
ncbi:Aste57867_22550 [Aphanomyces stellatus]|uniref:Peroxisomal membrane protein PEX14 n=1 Tax=Aphanomyces stellatus TaxID=120398 RepID=A0A485LM70_9STRA|nr:hypothetical protein As57867_022480 [Aphanomyces stellatus]VFT99209.1 Aste57867_22550 [Aphanomyces stellatus]